MERSSEYEDLAAALAEARPVPRADFATELDELVAAGFPRPSRFGGHLTSIAARFRLSPPRRPLLAAGATALAAIVIATVIVASNESASGPIALNRPQPADRPHADSMGSALGELSNSNAGYGFTSLSRATHRDIERSAEIALLADPADVAEDSSKVFSAVHDARGIVLHSTTTAGRNAGAHFDLLIPSARLGDALAAFSTIDEVSSRHEASADITAPTVALGEQLQDSRAKIDGLLSQLAAAETESESDAIEVELRGERRRAAQLRARLSKLRQRVDFSRVSLRIETDSASDEPNGAWGIGDAWGDAGHILGIAAGVTIVGLALLGPFALICLLAWVSRRAWLQRARARALA